MKRIGLFGGTFNPIHVGHLRTSVEVLEGFALDEVCLIPSALPPHKSRGILAESRHRMEMCRIALEGAEGLSLSDVEIRRTDIRPSYTIDTVSHLQSGHPEENRFYMIVGVDAFLEIDTWKSFRKLLAAVPFIVMARPGKRFTRSSKGWSIFEDYLKTVISNRFEFTWFDFGPFRRPGYIHEYYRPVIPFDTTLLDISSTRIRRDIKDGESIRYLVPEGVENYIKEKGLYV